MDNKVYDCKMRLRMYDGMIMMPMGIINVDYEHEGTKTTLHFQVVNTNKDLLSAAASLE